MPREINKDIFDPKCSDPQKMLKQLLMWKVGSLEKGSQLYKCGNIDNIYFMIWQFNLNFTFKYFWNKLLGTQ